MGEPTWQDLVAGWELFRDPIYCAAIAGGVLGFLSVYVVLRRMVFLSAAVTQGAGLGVALSFYAGIHLGWQFEPTYGAVALSLAVAGALVFEPGRVGLSRETVLGVAFALTGGAAILVGAKITQEAHDIEAILFGTAVLVMPEDLTRVMWVGAAVMLLHLWWFRGVTFASFDPVAARVQGLPVRVLEAAVLLSVGVMVGVSARALGSLPTFALSTMPGAAALLVVRSRLPGSFALATLFGVTIGAGGYLVAFFEELPVGASQTTLAALLVICALGWRGLVMLVRRLV